MNLQEDFNHKRRKISKNKYKMPGSLTKHFPTSKTTN